MSLEIDSVSKWFGAFAALDKVSLVGAEGEFLALLGPSGSGKTTLLRILAGLERPDAGVVRFNGEDLSGTSARDRRAGFVFQHYALFRHMTVAKNIAFGLEVRRGAEKLPKKEIAARVERLLALVQLDTLGGRYPAQLSGGQRQRVALARALAIEPRMLLLDEPFGALDAKVRRELRRWLRGLHAEMGLTTIFVTHDQEEALDLADRVVVMNNGRIEQVGAPADVYGRPANAFVYDFMGGANRLPCDVRGGVVTFGGFAASTGDHAPGPDRAALAYARAHDIRVAPEGQPGLPATVLAVFPAGGQPRVECRLGDGQVVEAAVRTGDPWPALGQRIALQPERVRVFE
ncbi:MAG: sulfate/molybdate ABC transporter ATP-binding protein [Alphaproteobacteria bacterium]|nr:sulfate/molybdate ABC transporter ATP-binding protein [Alphaproteobacteria bacterium]